jgi:DNA-binding NarL/FixJ family response regulator
MQRRRIFIVGDSLFAEGLTQMLANLRSVEVIGSAPTPDVALPSLVACLPDAVIVAGEDEMSTSAFGQLLAAYPDLPVICADLSRDTVQIVTSHRIGTRTSDLLAAIQSLPRRRQQPSVG